MSHVRRKVQNLDGAWALWGIVTELGPSDFNGQTLKRRQTLAAVFLASWCPFCRRFQPAFEVAAKTGGILWASVDVSDDNNELWDIFKIEVVPTIVVFKEMKPVWRKDGVLGRGLSDADIGETLSKLKSLGA